MKEDQIKQKKLVLSLIEALFKGDFRKEWLNTLEKHFRLSLIGSFSNLFRPFQIKSGKYVYDFSANGLTIEEKKKGTFLWLTSANPVYTRLETIVSCLPLIIDALDSVEEEFKKRIKELKKLLQEYYTSLAPEIAKEIL